jgi:peptidoglycan/xylan/chitin deacetylase (PgdA/CDA1 family)
LKHGIPCIFFLATDFIDNSSMYFRNKVSLVINRFSSVGQNETEQIVSLIGEACGQKFLDKTEFITWIKTLTDVQLIDRICELAEVEVSRYLSEIKPYLTKDQIVTLSKDGFTIGAHSRSHHKLGKLALSAADDEIIDSCRIIKELTTQQKIPFSFPNSGEGLDRDHLDVLRAEFPFIGLFFDTKGLRKDRHFIHNRIWVEAPKFNPGGYSSMPEVLHLAYQEYSKYLLLSTRAKLSHKQPTLVPGNLDQIEAPTLVD